VLKRFLLSLFLLVAACAPSWIQGGGVYVSPPHKFSIQIPEGWMRLNIDDYLLISRDGPFLHYVLVQERPIEKPFAHTRKRLHKGMLPLEGAELLIDEMMSDQLIFNLRVMENSPAKIDGHDGFRLLFTYDDRDGLELKTIYYGFLAGESYYNLRYTAAKRGYFERDLNTFHKIVDSLQIH
jgi:hypothetical protein